MKRLFIAWLLLTTALFGAWQIASAQMLMPIVNFGGPRAAPPSKTLTLLGDGGVVNNDSSVTIPVTLSGSSSYIVVTCAEQYAVYYATVTVGGTPLNFDEQQGSAGGVGIFSGTVSLTGSQNVVATLNAPDAYQTNYCWVYSITNLTTQSVNAVYGNSTRTNLSVNVNSGDYLFYIGTFVIPTPSVSGTSPTPNQDNVVSINESANWLIAANNASLTITQSNLGNASFQAAAQYR